MYSIISANSMICYPARVLPPESRALGAIERSGLRSRLGWLAVEDGSDDWPPWGAADVFLSGPHLAQEANRMVYLYQRVDQPQRLMVTDEIEPAPNSSPHSTVLTEFNRPLVDSGLRPGKAVYWAASDGTELEGLLVPAETDEPGPLVVWLHGGPAEHASHTFSPHFQVLTAAANAGKAAGRPSWSPEWRVHRPRPRSGHRC